MYKTKEEHLICKSISYLRLVVDSRLCNIYNGNKEIFEFCTEREREREHWSLIVSSL